jgi:hypothetical protein
MKEHTFVSFQLQLEQYNYAVHKYMPDRSSQGELLKSDKNFRLLRTITTLNIEI